MGPTLPVMSLKLVREYYDSPLGEAVAAVAASQGASSAGAWEPLLQVPFVEGLWQQLQDLWRSLGCCGPQEDGAASLLARYASASGLLAAAQTDSDKVGSSPRRRGPPSLPPSPKPSCRSPSLFCLESSFPPRVEVEQVEEEGGEGKGRGQH